MKELSIKEKAERYDELLKKLRKAKVDNNVCDERYCCVIDDIVPELEEDESEDERIIKAIKSAVLQLTDIYLQEKYGLKQSDCITWLEKQGESDETKAKMFLIDKGYPIDANGTFPTYEEMYNIIREGLENQGEQEHQYKSRPRYVGEEELLGANKQGEQIPANSVKTCKDEQKPNPYSGTSFEYNGHTWGMCARDNGVDMLYDKHIIGHFENQGETKILDLFKPAMEAINEEKVDNANKVEPKDYNDIDPHFGKPTDKVEPKFKVGNWVVWDNKISCYINNIYQGKESLMYTITDTHNMTRSYSVKGFDNNAHLWTIQDAKDGDVLCSGQIIVIFKHFEDPSYRQHIVAYIGLDTSGNVQITDGTWTLGIDKAKPATKEQRDLLFSKMHEEGYEWDVVKKELKKVLKEMQEPTDKVEHKRMTKLEDKLSSLVVNAVHIYCKENELDTPHYVGLILGDRLAKEWSQDILTLAKDELKMTEQKPAWSEEDEYKYNIILHHLDLRKEKYKKECNQEEQDRYQCLYDWLKSIKSRVQPKQEWSEEDEEIRNNCIYWLEKARKYFEKDEDLIYDKKWIVKCTDWLKSLKGRVGCEVNCTTTWKPSDEQMDALDSTLQYSQVSHNSFEYLNSLFNDLKKLREE